MEPLGAYLAGRGPVERTLTRRRFLAGSGVGFLTAVACGAPSASPVPPAESRQHAEPTRAEPSLAPPASQLLPLKLGLAFTPVSALPLSVLWLAKDLGFYEREGLDLDLQEMPGTPIVITAMLTEDLDVGNVSTEDVIRLTATGTLDVRAIHSPDPRLYFIVAARQDIGAVADLRGRTFGIARVGSLDHTMTTLVLRARGLDAADVRFVPIGAPTGRAQALLGGQIDATAFSIATYKAIEGEPGVKILLGVDDYFAAAPVVQKVNAVTAKVLKEKPEHLRRFTAAILKASRHFAEHQAAWIDAMQQRRPDIERQDLVELWEQYRASWSVNGALDLDAYSATADFIYRGESFKDVPRIGVQEWTDTSILNDVRAAIGVDPRFDAPGRQVP